jgi:hypothetical protein
MCTFFRPLVINTLRDFFALYNPGNWLFPGQKPGQHISTRSVEKFLQKPKLFATLKKML